MGGTARSRELRIPPARLAPLHRTGGKASGGHLKVRAIDEGIKSLSEELHTSRGIRLTGHATNPLQRSLPDAGGEWPGVGR